MTIALQLGTRERLEIWTNVLQLGITASALAYRSFIEFFQLISVTIGAINSANQAASAVGALLDVCVRNKMGRKYYPGLADLAT